VRLHPFYALAHRPDAYRREHAATGRDLPRPGLGLRWRPANAAILLGLG
jgi:hypothetical protein